MGSRYREIVESLADGLVVLDEAGQVVFSNPAFAAFVGAADPDAVPGRPFAAYFAERDRKGIDRGVRDAKRFEGSLLRMNTPVLMAAARMPGSGTLVTITDYAERQAVADRLALTRKMDGLASLAGGIAHDFNNLLTGILGNASRIRLADPSEEVKELARSVEDSAELAARLTQRLMTLVRGQAPHRRLLDVSDLVRHTLALTKKVLPDSIELRTSYEPNLPSVLADESQLQQAILNLCINARDAMMDKNGEGILQFHVRSCFVTKLLDDGTAFEERAVELEVSDNGPGIPAELRDRIFDPFFTTKGLGRGLGLGLATVFQLVEAHGGTLKVDEAPGGGACFRLRLPVHAGRGEPATRPSRGSSSEYLAIPDAVILLAEDEQVVRELVAESLTARGYEVLTAEDGTQAAELWRKHCHRIDLLFLDVRMPGMEGPDVLRLARKDAPGIPAVFSSGFIPDDASCQEVFSGVVYLPKPYRVPDLISIVENALKYLGDPAGTTAQTPISAVFAAEEADDDLWHRSPSGSLDGGTTLVDQTPFRLEERNAQTTTQTVALPSDDHPAVEFED
jgi:PAS domain S-box-containing protein